MTLSMYTHIYIYIYVYIYSYQAGLYFKTSPAFTVFWVLRRYNKYLECNAQLPHVLVQITSFGCYFPPLF